MPRRRSVPLTITTYNWKAAPNTVQRGPITREQSAVRVTVKSPVAHHVRAERPSVARPAERSPHQPPDGSLAVNRKEPCADFVAQMGSALLTPESTLQLR